MPNPPLPPSFSPGAGEMAEEAVNDEESNIVTSDICRTIRSFVPIGRFGSLGLEKDGLRRDKR
jgi:hypothetical protein